MNSGLNRLALLDGFEEVELLCLALVVKMKGIVSAEAGITETIGLTIEKRIHAVSAEIGNAVRINEFTDFFQGIT